MKQHGLTAGLASLLAATSLGLFALEKTGNQMGRAGSAHRSYGDAQWMGMLVPIALLFAFLHFVIFGAHFGCTNLCNVLFCCQV